MLSSSVKNNDSDHIIGNRYEIRNLQYMKLYELR